MVSDDSELAAKQFIFPLQQSFKDCEGFLFIRMLCALGTRELFG